MVRHITEVRPDLQVRALDLNMADANNIECISGSILDTNDLMNSVQDCDYVIHLAAMLGVKRTESSPLQCLNVNVQGTINLLEACVREQVKKVVLASSSEVYGEPVMVPIREDSPLNPRSVYGISKITAEEYLKAYAQRYNIDWNIVRLFNMYGPGQTSEFVIPRFIASVQRGQSPVVYGDGSQIRAFCYVADGVSAIASLLDDDISNHTFNIGNPESKISMSDLANKVTSLLGNGIQPEFVPLSASTRKSGREIWTRIPDISKANETLGYTPKINLEEGLMLVAKSGEIPDSHFDPL